jgi:molybdate transport system substrate-binding protein
MRTPALALAVGVGACLFAPDAAAAQPRTLTVSVASSLADVMAEIGRAFERRGGARLTLNVAGSNFLSRQVVEGAAVDVFMSADEVQMDTAERAGRLVPGSRRDLLSNTLVVIVPARAKTDVREPRDLRRADVRRIAMANPDSVPAGVYGRQWLERAGVWMDVRVKVVPALTVRAALAAVRSARADAGVVFATDARTSYDVRVAYAVPEADAPPIRYPVAAVRGRHEAEALQLIAFLGSDVAGRIFEAAGFGRR